MLSPCRPPHSAESVLWVNVAPLRLWQQWTHIHDTFASHGRPRGRMHSAVHQMADSESSQSTGRAESPAATLGGMSSETAIRVRGLRKSYGETFAVDGIDL